MKKINVFRTGLAAILFGVGVGCFLAGWTLLQHWLQVAPSVAGGENTIAYFSHGEVFYLTPAQEWLEGVALGNGPAVLVLAAILAHPYVSYPWRPLEPASGATGTWAVPLMIACAAVAAALIVGYGELLASRALEIL